MVLEKDARKVRLLKIWEILSTQTDQEHPLSTEDIMDKLSEMGIESHNAIAISYRKNKEGFLYGRKDLFFRRDRFCKDGYYGNGR